MLCKFDLEKSNDLSIPVLKQAIYVVKFQYLYSIEGFLPQRVLFLGKALVVLKMRGMLWQNQKGKVVLHRCVQSLRYKLVNEIRKTRKQEGLSIENFALRCDIHPSYVGHIERGMQNPTLSTLERISQGLGISMDDLFKGHRYTDQCGERCNTTSISGHKRVCPLSKRNSFCRLLIVSWQSKTNIYKITLSYRGRFSCCKKVTLYNRKQRIATYK